MVTALIPISSSLDNNPDFVQVKPCLNSQFAWLTPLPSLGLGHMADTKLTLVIPCRPLRLHEALLRILQRHILSFIFFLRGMQLLGNMSAEIAISLPWREPTKTKANPRKKSGKNQRNGAVTWLHIPYLPLGFWVIYVSSLIFDPVYEFSVTCNQTANYYRV